MPTTLGNAQQRVERSIYERIRLILVEHGYLPDINDATFPDTVAGKAAWDAAKAQIITNKGFMVELFGVGSNKSKYLKTIPRIVVKKRRFLPSNIGAKTILYEQNETGTYTKLQNSTNLGEGFYDIHLCSETAEQDRVLTAVIGVAFSTLDYVDYHDKANDNDRFLMDFIGSYDDEDNTEGLQNYVMAYRVPDIAMAPPQEIGKVSKIKQITLDTNGPLGNQENLSTTVIP